MNAFLGDVAQMTLQDLSDAMDDLAARWRKNPYLSNEYSDSMRYVEIQGALKYRFGVSKRIEAIDGPTNYHVV